MEPGADGISRLHLEEEVFGVRALRHAFRAKDNLTLQGWTTLLQPIDHSGYHSDPTTWLLTADAEFATRKDDPPKLAEQSPEYADAVRGGWLKVKRRALPPKPKHN